MKKKRISIIVISMILILVCIGIYLFIQSENKITLKESNFIFEFGDKVPLEVENYIKNKKEDKIANSKIRFENVDLFDVSNNEIRTVDSKYLNVGKYKLYIQYKDKKYDFTIEVKDTTKPNFIDSNDVIVLEQNSVNVDLLKFYEASDLSSTTITIESDYDIEKIGEYKAKIKAKDSYNNINEREVIIKVISYEDLKDNEVTECLDGTIYKSYKRIEAEKDKIETDKSDSYKNNTIPKIEIIDNNSNGSTNKNENNNTSNDTPTIVNATYRTDISNQIVNKINEYRQSNNLPALPVTAEAQNEADRRAKEIVENPTHEGSSYGFGENIGGGGIGTDFFTLWKESFAHNNAMLREQNTAIAVSIYQYNNQWYAVTVFRMNY